MFFSFYCSEIENRAAGEPQITLKLTRCCANSQTPQQEQRPRTSEGVVLTPQHRSATSSDTAESALSRPTWKIHGYESQVDITFDQVARQIRLQYYFVICSSHKVNSAVCTHRSVFTVKLLPCVTPNPPCVLGPRVSQQAWFVGPGSAVLATNQRWRRRNVCAAINFYTSNKAGVTDYTFSHLSTARSWPVRTPVCYRCTQRTPANSAQIKITHCLFCRILIIVFYSNGANGQREPEAVISQQKGHYGSRSKAATAAAETHVWSRPETANPLTKCRAEITYGRADSCHKIKSSYLYDWQ